MVSAYSSRKYQPRCQSYVDCTGGGAQWVIFREPSFDVCIYAAKQQHQEVLFDLFKGDKERDIIG